MDAGTIAKVAQAELALEPWSPASQHLAPTHPFPLVSDFLLPSLASRGFRESKSWEAL